MLPRISLTMLKMGTLLSVVSLFQRKEKKVNTDEKLEFFGGMVNLKILVIENNKNMLLKIYIKQPHIEIKKYIVIN